MQCHLCPALDYWPSFVIPIYARFDIKTLLLLPLAHTIDPPYIVVPLTADDQGSSIHGALLFFGCKLGVKSTKIQRTTVVLSVKSKIDYQADKLVTLENHDLRYINMHQLDYYYILQP